MSYQIKYLPDWFSNIYVEGKHEAEENLVILFDKEHKGASGLSYIMSKR